MEEQTFIEKPVFSVIIPVFNKWELTQNCLISLKKYTKMPYEVIVIDNASSDETAVELAPFGASLFKSNFTRIRNEENRNYGPANNAGAKIARAPLLFFLNNDTIVTEGWETPLVEAFKVNAHIGAVGSLLLYEDNKIQHVGVAWDIDFSPYHIYSHFLNTHRVASKKRQVQTLTGAALMMPKSLFFEIGCFHEGFRNGFEDVELCIRITNAGKKLYCIPSSVIYHLESQTPGRTKYNKENSILLTQLLKSLTFNVDTHAHALRDGFRPFINKCCNLVITLTDEEERELTAQYENASLDTLCATLGMNPYWKHGSFLLLDAFEKNKEYDMAFSLAFYLSYTFPSEENIKRAFNLYSLTQRESVDTGLQRIMKTFVMYQTSSSRCKKALRNIYNIGLSQNDSFLIEEVNRVSKQWGL